MSTSRPRKGGRPRKGPPSPENLERIAKRNRECSAEYTIARDELAQAIRETLIDRGITLRQLAKALDLNLSTVTRWIHSSDIKISQLIYILSPLRMSVNPILCARRIDSKDKNYIKNILDEIQYKKELEKEL